jgi:hypothetical protein
VASRPLLYAGLVTAAMAFLFIAFGLIAGDGR